MSYRSRALYQKSHDFFGNRYYDFKKRFQQASVDEAFMSFSKEVKQTILSWAKNPTGFLLLTGDPGTGKTYALSALYNFMENLKAKELESYGMNPEDSWAYFRVYSEFHFLNEIKKCFDFNVGQTPHDRIEMVSESKVIFYDDLATCKGYDWQQNILQEFVNERYARSDTATIFTTNFNMQEIAEIIDRKTADRLFDRTSSFVLEFEGESLRQHPGRNA